MAYVVRYYAGVVDGYYRTWIQRGWHSYAQAEATYSQHCAHDQWGITEAYMVYLEGGAPSVYQPMNRALLR